jgi:hypothetical protein
MNSTSSKWLLLAALCMGCGHESGDDDATVSSALHSAARVTVAASASPATASANQQVLVDFTVTSSRAVIADVNIRVLAPDGSVAYAASWPAQNLAANTPVVIEEAVVVDATDPAGTYSIGAQVLRTGSTSVLFDKNALATLVITAPTGTGGGSGSGGGTAAGGGNSGVCGTAAGWWGLRGCSSASSGKAAVICLPGDSTCDDATIVAGNLVVPPTLGACSTSSTICTIKTFYDQSGHALDFTQPSIANRATLLLDCGNHKACAQFTAASSQVYSTSRSVTQAQPFTMSAVASYSGDTNGGAILSATNNIGILFDNGNPNELVVYDSAKGAEVAQTATDGQAHALEAVFNGAMSTAMVNGASSSGDLGASTALSGSLLLGSLFGVQFPTMKFFEGGLWGSALSSSQLSAVTNDQMAYWAISAGGAGGGTGGGTGASGGGSGATGGGAGGGSTVVLSADYAQWGTGPYYAFNSVWNAGSLINGTDFTQSIALNTSTFPNGTTISWDWPSTPASYLVYSFPGVFYGTYGSMMPATNIPAKQISSITRLQFAHNLSLSGQLDEFDVIYDYYTTSTPDGTNLQHEIEILVHTPSYFRDYLSGFSGNKTFVDPSGLTWTVAGPSSGTPPQIFFMPSAAQDILNTTIDARALMNFAVSQGLMSGSEYFDGTSIGAEPSQNNGTLKINTFNVSYN